MILAVLSQCFVLDNLMCKFAVIFRVNISPLTSLSRSVSCCHCCFSSPSRLSSETIHHSTSLSFMHFLMFNLFLDRARERRSEIVFYIADNCYNQSSHLCDVARIGNLDFMETTGEQQREVSNEIIVLEYHFR